MVKPKKGGIGRREGRERIPDQEGRTRNRAGKKDKDGQHEPRPGLAAECPPEEIPNVSCHAKQSCWNRSRVGLGQSVSKPEREIIYRLVAGGGHAPH